MEDFLKYILIVGIIIVGIAKEVKKTTPKAKRRHPVPPAPITEEPTPEEKLPHDMWDEIFPLEDIFQPKTTQKNSSPSPKAPKRKPKKAKPETESHTPAPSAHSGQELAESEGEFTIHSAEEARRAIIWGEIMQRKY